MTFKWVPLLLATLSIGNHVIEAFNTRTVSPLCPRISTERTFGCYATTKERKVVEDEATNGESINGLNGANGSVNGVNGHKSSSDSATNTKTDPDYSLTDYNITQVLDEISQKINDGSMEVIENITNAMDERFDTMTMTQTSAQEMSAYIAD